MYIKVHELWMRNLNTRTGSFLYTHHCVYKCHSNTFCTAVSAGSVCTGGRRHRISLVALASSVPAVCRTHWYPPYQTNTSDWLPNIRVIVIRVESSIISRLSLNSYSTSLLPYMMLKNRLKTKWYVIELKEHKLWNIEQSLQG